MVHSYCNHISLTIQTGKIEFYFEFSSLTATPGQALENAAPGTVVINTFSGRLAQVWSCLVPDQDQGGNVSGLTEAPEAGKLKLTKLPIIDIPSKLPYLPGRNEFRGCEPEPANRSYIVSIMSLIF